MTQKTLYDVLQVSRHADPETIKAAYKSLVQRNHPDKNPDNPDAEKYLKEINRAYESLSDPVKRAGYDAALAEDDADQFAGRKGGSGFSSSAAPAGNDASRKSQGGSQAGNTPPNNSTGKAAPVDRGDNSPLFLYIPIARLILMSIASFGLYQFYWFYKNWRYIKERQGLNISPFWRAQFGVFFCHSLLRRIHEDEDARSIYYVAPFSPNWLATGWVVLMIADVYISIQLKEPSGTLTLLGLLGATLSALCFVPVQNYINDVTEIRNPRQPFYGWSLGHIVVLIFSAIFVLSGFFSRGYADYQQRTAAAQSQSQNPNDPLGLYPTTNAPPEAVAPKEISYEDAVKRGPETSYEEATGQPVQQGNKPSADEFLGIKPSADEFLKPPP